MSRRLSLPMAALCYVLSGCADAVRDVHRIVVIPKGLTHEHWQSVHRGALRAAEELTARGWPTRIIWDGPLRESDALAQIRIVDRRVSTRVDGIVLAPQHSQTLIAPVARAVQQGIPVVIMDSGLDAPELYVKYVATDNYHGGWLAAEHLLNVLRADGKPAPRLILFRYQVGSQSTQLREQGFEDYVNREIERQRRAGQPTITWLSKDKYAGATKDSALREAAPLVNRFRDQIDGIFAVNESSANGMLDALRSLGLHRRVRLMGFDSSVPLQQAVRDDDGTGRGEVVGLILQDPYKMGYYSVWTLVHHLRGYDVSAGGKVLSTGEHLVTRDNIDAPSTRELFDPLMQGQRILTPPNFPRRSSWGLPDQGAH
ncbi:MAG: substrate-binding domain-containing protein [Gemmataceae bacterium]|nr:substrate-binding domain-containing protein [Gemmataceae bacterium]